MSISSRMLLRLEQSIKIPETTLNIRVCWHFFKSQLSENLPKLSPHLVHLKYKLMTSKTLLWAMDVNIHLELAAPEHWSYKAWIPGLSKTLLTRSHESDLLLSSSIGVRILVLSSDGKSSMNSEEWVFASSVKLLRLSSESLHHSESVGVIHKHHQSPFRPRPQFGWNANSTNGPSGRREWMNFPF